MLTRNETQKLHRVISEEILNYMQFRDHEYWIITVINVNLSKNLEYLDIFLSATNFKKDLFKVVKPVLKNIKRKISKDLARYKSPIIRLKDASVQDSENKVLNLLNEISREIN